MPVNMLIVISMFAAGQIVGTIYISGGARRGIVASVIVLFVYALGIAVAARI